jgi:hypothetical protein
VTSDRLRLSATVAAPFAGALTVSLSRKRDLEHVTIATQRFCNDGDRRRACGLPVRMVERAGAAGVRINSTSQRTVWHIACFSTSRPDRDRELRRQDAAEDFGRKLTAFPPPCCSRGIVSRPPAASTHAIPRAWRRGSSHQQSHPLTTQDCLPPTLRCMQRRVVFWLPSFFDVY